MKRIFFIRVFILWLLMLSPSAGYAIGVLYAGAGGTGYEPLSIKYVHTTVEIIDQVAVTKVDQVFQNHSNRELEGIYIFPLPEEATVTEFALWIEGKRVVAEILEKEEARRQYETLLRRWIDPALLEYLGGNVFKASVFPIPARGERRLEIEYSELLPYDFGVIKYLFPLKAEGFSPTPLESVIVDVQIFSQQPIVSAHSPSHGELAQIDQKSPENVTVFFGDENFTPSKDFRLELDLSPREMGLNLLTYNPPDTLDEDGYYIFWIVPPEELGEEEIINKSIIFTLDVSSSMEGQRIAQAKEALHYFIDLLLPGDRFNIITFGTTVESFEKDFLVASPENKEKAKRFVDGLRALGLTNIEGGLKGALRQSFSDSTANMVVFLTDGEPTYGETDPDKILQTVKEDNSQRIRIFVFGVGGAVNRPFLIKLSRDNYGCPVFVEEEGELGQIIENFFTRISHPVLSHLVLDFGALRTYDTYPVNLPDLFAGSQLLQVGRYTGAGRFTIILQGKVAGKAIEASYPATFSDEEGGYRFVSRIWASQKIDYLLEQIELLGEQKELVDAVKELSLKYQIVTPYTSMLVTEPEEPVAVEEEEGQMLSWQGKSFFYQDGFWVDSEFTPDIPLVDVQFGSEDYFYLLKKKPGLERYLLLDENVVVVFEGTAYRVASRNSGEALLLGQNYPNPFNAQTSIPYLVPASLSTSPVKVELRIYDVMGRLVKTASEESQGPGFHILKWDGTDNQGREVSSGVYLYHLEMMGHHQVRKMLLIR